MSPDQLVKWLLGGSGTLLLLLIGVVGFLVRRDYARIDSHLHEQDQQAARRDGKLDNLATKWSEHDRTLAVHDMRLSHLEAGDAVRRAEHEQFAGFLQAQGFRRSDGPGSGGGSGG